MLQKLFYNFKYRSFNFIWRATFEHHAPEGASEKPEPKKENPHEPEIATTETSTAGKRLLEAQLAKLRDKAVMDVAQKGIVESIRYMTGVADSYKNDRRYGEIYASAKHYEGELRGEEGKTPEGRVAILNRFLAAAYATEENLPNLEPIKEPKKSVAVADTNTFLKDDVEFSEAEAEAIIAKKPKTPEQKVAIVKRFLKSSDPTNIGNGIVTEQGLRQLNIDLDDPPTAVAATKKLQVRLNNALAKANMPRIKVDGIFGRETFAAIVRLDGRGDQKVSEMLIVLRTPDVKPFEERVVAGIDRALEKDRKKG